MNIYITKLNGLPLQDIAQYKQRMTAEIAHQLGCREMGVYRYNGATESQESLNGRLDGIIAGIEWGNDVVICQFPTGNGFKYEWELVKRLKMYQSRVVIFIHDSKNLVTETERANVEQAIRLYNQAEVLIVPSLAMRYFLEDNGIKKDMKFVIQEMWDYITDFNFFSSPQFRKEIHFVDGNSFEGIDGWKGILPLKLYTAASRQGQNIHNMGTMSQGELLYSLSKGGFGLAWYQDKNMRKSMEYDVSFSVARYLAAGIPVIVPGGISNQILIEKNHLGLVVNSLDEAVTAIESMTESDYREYIRCVRQFAPALRNGYYTKKCLFDAVKAVYRKDAGEIITPANVYYIGEQAFTYTVLRESYGGDMALSWSYRGEPSGFLVYSISGEFVYETRNIHQHYFLIKRIRKENGFVIKAYIDTLKGKMVVAESEQIYLREDQYDHPEASLVIPAYNAQDYLVRGIDIALAQSFCNLEIIIVDDGSTDHTKEIVDWYAEKYPNVVAIHQKNSGVGAARNTGIRCARGEYIGFMDSDDMLNPHMIASLYYSAKKNNCDIAITSVYRIEETGYKVFIQYPMEEDKAIAVNSFFQLHFNRGMIFSVGVWNKIYRASLIRERLFPEYFLGEDGAWTPYILSYADKICYINGYLYEYDRIIRKSTLEGQWMDKSPKERFSMYRNIVTFYLKNGNPGKIGFLKMLAKSNLLGWKRIYGDPDYEKLWEELNGSL